MRNRVLCVLVTSLLGAGLVLASDAVAAKPRTDGCHAGVLAVDDEGDGTYAGLTGTDLESTSGDIVEVSTTLGASAGPGSGTGVARSGARGNAPGKPGAEDGAPVDPVFTTTVAELGPTEAHHFDLLVRLELVTEAGDVIVIQARRSNVLGASATVDGKSEGASAEFDEEDDEIRVTVPAGAFDGVSTFSLQLARTRYDTGAVLSPLADEASGTCSVVLDARYSPPPAEDHAGLDTSILVIDTGVNGKHPEFADGQITAWWDFSKFKHGDGNDAAPAGDPGDRTWFDTDGDGELHGDRDDPYDPHGHGSSVSSMAAGSNAFSTAKTPSACPGCSFAVAKVQDESANSLNGSIGQAIRWGVDVLEVDVITVSIGAIVPVPAAILQETYSAAEHARDNGVLVVFANGNGWGNAGIPGQPGGFMPYGNSPHVLSVGADGVDSYRVTTDPEVVAVFRVHAATGTGEGYRNISGTSFSAPFTAGVAARIIGEARACGTKKATYDVSADSIEQLVKYTAEDRPDVPPTFEGYGVVTLETMASAVEVACGRAELPSPDPLNDFYVTNVSGTQRELATTKLDGVGGMTRTGFTGVTGSGEIGPSSPSGPKDAEIYIATVPAGETFAMVATGTGDLADVNDFDMVLYEGVHEVYDGEKLDISGNGGSGEESLSWVNTTGGDVVVSAIVYGWAVGHSQPFDFTTSHDVAPDFDGYVLADNLFL